MKDKATTPIGKFAPNTALLLAELAVCVNCPRGARQPGAAIQWHTDVVLSLTGELVQIGVSQPIAMAFMIKNSRCIVVCQTSLLFGIGSDNPSPQRAIF